jgi:hypothetical protein
MWRSRIAMPVSKRLQLHLQRALDRARRLRHRRDLPLSVLVFASKLPPTVSGHDTVTSPPEIL